MVLNYIIVTPSKNEEVSLPKLAESIKQQKVLPSLWLIIDDGSTDSSPQILSEMSSQYEWVHIRKLDTLKRDLSFHYSTIVRNGIDEALKIMDNQSILVDFISLVDADIVLPPDYFESLFLKFEENPKLGVASGIVKYYDGNDFLFETGYGDWPIGAIRVWSTSCYLSSGGFPISYSADSVSNVLAYLDNWDLALFHDIVALETRRTSSAEGLWKGFKIKGESDYYRDYHPLYVLSKFFKYSLTKPYYIGVSYLYGYLIGVFIIKRKLEYQNVRSYYRRRLSLRLKSVLSKEET